MADPANPAPPPTATATEQSPATAPDAPAPRKIAPIPPEKEQQSAEAARDEKGRFAKSEPDLPDLLQPTDGVDDDYDRAKASLDGDAPPRITPKVTKKPRARDALAVAPPPEGGEGVPPPSGEVSKVEPPEGVKADDEPPPPDGEGFEVAGEKYRDKAHFEQSFRSLRGMYKSELTRRQEAEATARANYSAAIAWQARSEQARSEQSSPTPAGGTAPGAQPGGTGTGSVSDTAAKTAAATGATEESILKSVDWDKYKAIRETHGVETAQLWAMEQSLLHIKNRYDSRLEEMTKPAKEAERLTNEGMAIGQTMDQMSGWTYEGSNDLIYPELQDEDAAEEIARVVTAMHQRGLTLDYLKSQDGVHQAILNWRDWRARNKRPWAPAGSPPPASTATAPRDDVSAALASLRAASPGTVVTRNAPVRPASAEGGRGAAIVQGILDSDKTSEFGWPR